MYETLIIDTSQRDVLSSIREGSQATRCHDKIASLQSFQRNVCADETALTKHAKLCVDQAVRSSHHPSLQRRAPIQARQRLLHGFGRSRLVRLIYHNRLSRGRLIFLICTAFSRAQTSVGYQSGLTALVACCRLRSR